MWGDAALCASNKKNDVRLNVNPSLTEAATVDTVTVNLIFVHVCLMSLTRSVYVLVH